MINYRIKEEKMENNVIFAQSSGGFFVQIIPLILIFAIFWFLIIRPQQMKLIGLQK